MKNIVTTTKNIYVTSETGVQMNISTSQNLDPTLKARIEKMVDIPSKPIGSYTKCNGIEQFSKRKKSYLH